MQIDEEDTSWPVVRLPGETIVESGRREAIERLQERCRHDIDLAADLVELYSAAWIDGHSSEHERPRPAYSNPFWRVNLWGLEAGPGSG